MTTKFSTFSLSKNYSVAGSEDIFGASSNQKFVKDEMAFAPTPDSYSSLQKAAERVQSGKSVFFTSDEEAEKILADAKDG